MTDLGRNPWSRRRPFMRKRIELADPNSCLNRAGDNEIVFVLLGRDEDAPDTIRAWVQKRIARGKNKPEDEQMQEALRSAALMEAEQKEISRGATT